MSLKNIRFKEVETYSVYRVSVSNSDYKMIKDILGSKAKQISEESFLVDVSDPDTKESKLLKENCETLYYAGVKDAEASFIEIEMSGH